ncbi:glucose-1-phosphate thymidylyltransferase [Actinomadura harenae]|uniref:Glucose-1-phosphate thymidylyltransferase n=2 Tax=Actinomadura harenae TaxID=2483351 RepID=A0A3M2M2Y3_9ACTN|nr:glucose-1-phosphate thymidylyltransferase [Actinomadura harenae]
MKALVLSGGTGTRLRPFTYSMAKQLLPVANKPVLRHCLEAVRGAGITEVGVVVGDHHDQIRDAFGDGSGDGVRITYIEQPWPAGLAHAVLLARDFLGDDDFMMYLGDNIVAGGLTAAASDFGAHRPEVKLLVSKVDDPSRYGIAEFDASGRVFGLAEKPAEPRGDFAIMGIYFFTPAIHEAIARIRPSARGELEITDAIGEVMLAGGVVTAEEHTGYWRDAGTVDDLLDCNRFVLSGMRGETLGERDRHSVLRGEVLVEPGAKIIRSEVHGPAIVGADSVVEDSQIGPGTAIGRGCLLSGVQVEGSVLLDGAAVRGACGIRDSLIGRHAEVIGGRGRSGTRLRIGDHAFVELAA